MKYLPPLTDSIVVAVSRLVDDAQSGSREPSHSQIDFCVSQCNLTTADPKSQGQLVGKAKRVRAILSHALNDNFESGRRFVHEIISLVRGCGGFRCESSNYVGDEPIGNLIHGFAAEGYILTFDGDLRPQFLESLCGLELTAALESYTRRAHKGSDDAALLAGTSKDLLEATAAHIIQEIWGSYPSTANFPTLLGQAFVALDMRTSADKLVDVESPQHRLQRALYDAACAVNTLRNKQGTGHGRPWLASIKPEESRQAVQVMGIVAEMLLTGLKQKKSP
jgi:hypothetical protein